MHPTAHALPALITRPARPRPSTRARAAGWCCAAAGLLAALPVAADTVGQFSPFAGNGQVAVFDANTGSAGWVGRLDGLSHPVSAAAIGMASVVLFDVDPSAGTLAGRFELTDETDLTSTLFGSLSGMVNGLLDAGAGGGLAGVAFLTAGGQLSLDYLIEGGTGAFANASGFGLSFLDFDPAAAGDSYQEAGLFVLNAVPEPSSLALVLGACALLALRRSGHPVLVAAKAGTVPRRA